MKKDLKPSFLVKAKCQTASTIEPYSEGNTNERKGIVRIYLNPGKTAFEEAVNSEIFVDKTEMIRFLNTVIKTKQKYVCVSRPRRFGIGILQMTNRSLSTTAV